MTTRVLVFDGPRGPRRFEFLHSALLSGGDGKGERNATTIRKEARLFEALDAISTLAPTPQEPEHRVLSSNGSDPLSVTLAQEDFALLSEYADKAGWTPRASRDVVDLWDWLSTAEKRE
jgi:hypothetical protein